MNNQQSKLQKLLLRFSLNDQETNEYRIGLGALLAISVFYTQAYLSTTGTLDYQALNSVIAFAIAIPMIGFYLFFISTKKVKNLFISAILSLVAYVGMFACIYGIGFAFYHLNSIAGNMFVIVTSICAILYWILYTRTEPKDTHSS